MSEYKPFNALPFIHQLRSYLETLRGIVVPMANDLEKLKGRLLEERARVAPSGRERPAARPPRTPSTGLDGGRRGNGPARP